jgi:cytochrome c-type biogenesis protein CcmH/NrfG
LAISVRLTFSRFETLFSCYETIISRKQPNFADEFKQTMRMDMTLIFTVALAAALIVVVLALVAIIMYQRWRIGDQNVFIERFIHQIEEQRQKMRKAGIV